MVHAPADPDAEVVALSPRTLLATNRFVCEICGKGFQRDQNLQLHRRGHNLPWKLRQRTSLPSSGGGGRQGDAAAAPPRKRVYVCPEPTCVHHDPARALGDLTAASSARWPVAARGRGGAAPGGGGTRPRRNSGRGAGTTRRRGIRRAVPGGLRRVEAALGYGVPLCFLFFFFNDSGIEIEIM